jgi:zinc/manganese transport system ATP-binding protein
VNRVPLNVVEDTTLIELDGVTIGYDGPAVLHHIHLRVEAGDFIGIVGPSGAGKTTLLRALLGAIEPRIGTIHKAGSFRIGYVPQIETVDWNFPVTVSDVVLTARHRERRWPWPTRDERGLVNDLLDRLGVGGLGDRHIRALSGGQQQRVFVARALLGDPQLLLLDEPTSGVDMRTRHDVLHLLGDLNDEGIAVVLTTHDLNGIAAHLPRLVCVNGHITGEGTPFEVLTPTVLEATYGAPMDVLDHMGVPMVVDRVRRMRTA